MYKNEQKGRGESFLLLREFENQLRICIPALKTPMSVGLNQSSRSLSPSVNTTTTRTSQGVKHPNFHSKIVRLLMTATTMVRDCIYI